MLAACIGQTRVDPARIKVFHDCLAVGEIDKRVRLCRSVLIHQNRCAGTNEPFRALVHAVNIPRIRAALYGGHLVAPLVQVGEGSGELVVAKPVFLLVRPPPQKGMHHLLEEGGARVVVEEAVHGVPGRIVRLPDFRQPERAHLVGPDQAVRLAPCVVPGGDVARRTRAAVVARGAFPLGGERAIYRPRWRVTPYAEQQLLLPIVEDGPR
mmetsp:Transcript_61234/g.186941  ORF Transcript_61234/g.186941 Transcript_61234/m.186941 type:complete len:210 (-) Transcript_61234:251-880(-)